MVPMADELQSTRIEIKRGAQSPRAVQREPRWRPISRQELAREGGRREKNESDAGQAHRDCEMVGLHERPQANHFRFVEREPEWGVSTQA